jgi:hypothetical protein
MTTTFAHGELVIAQGQIRIFHYEAGANAYVSITPKGKLSRVPLNRIRAKEER